MELQIYHLVNKLSEIFDLEEPRAETWAKRLVRSSRTSKPPKPVEESLEAISEYRKDDGIKLVYEEITRQGQLRGAAEILEFATRLVADDNIRKFVKIHKLLRENKMKKRILQQQQQQQQQLQQQQFINQQLPPPIQHTHQFSAHQTPQPQFRQPQGSSSIHHQAPTTPFATPHAAPYATPQRSTKIDPHPTHIYHTPNQRPTDYGPHGTSTSMVAITPAAFRNKRDRSRKSERDQKRKNDGLYREMKAFLNQNQFLSFDFKKIDWTKIPAIAPLSSMTVQEQESALINDLLYVLIGTEGNYIRMQPSRESPNKHTIGVERGGDELIYTLATRIIKICPLYSTVVHYAEDVNFGLVNQALAAPVRDLVKEYLTLISTIQSRAMRDEMTLQSMWFSLQPIFHRMEALKQILDQISRESCSGGHTLSVLHDRVIVLRTDPRTHDFCIKLMQAATEPYFKILDRWLYLGLIEDPYGEFFIEDTEAEANSRTLLLSGNYNNAIENQCQQNQDLDAFWRKRFQIPDETKVPEFIKSKKEIILDTGKYLRVIRQYGKKLFRPLEYEPLTYSTESGRYDERIDEAYKYASSELLHLLLVENNLIDRLYSLRRYFLFFAGDFFVQFIDMADEELSKTKDDVDMPRLNALLELALRNSSCDNDPYKDDLHLFMSDGNLYQLISSINIAGGEDGIGNPNSSHHSNLSHSTGSLFGWEAITFSLDIPWPLSMIICKDYCQTLYQMMFRHLFCCNYIACKLEGTWHLYNASEDEIDVGVTALYSKMLHFIRSLQSYIFEIAEPSFQILIKKFQDGAIENVNEAVQLQRGFLTGLAHDSMLTDNELLGLMTKLLLTCMDFTVVMESSKLPRVFKERMLTINEKFNYNLKALKQALVSRSQDYAASNKWNYINERLAA